MIRHLSSHAISAPGRRWRPNHVPPTLVGLAIGVGLCLAGCATPAPNPPDEARRSEAPKAIEVATVVHSLTFRYLGDDPSPAPPREREEGLDSLLASGDIGEGDQARIERGAGVAADARARAIAARLRHEGLKVDVAEVSRIQDAEVRVVVTHLAALVRGCPDWSDATGDGPRNTLPRDYGCAVAGDLAAMVADPRDLVRGRRLAPQVGDPALFAMRRYRYGDPTSPAAAAPVNIIAPTTSNATAPPPPQARTPAAAAAPAAASANGAAPAGGPAAAAAAALGVTPARPS